jgi:hypothetical protein
MRCNIVLNVLSPIEGSRFGNHADRVPETITVVTLVVVA